VFSESFLEKNKLTKKSNSANAFAKNCFAKPVMLKKAQANVPAAFSLDPNFGEIKIEKQHKG